MLGSAICIAAVASTAATIGFTVYLFTSEAQGRLPKLFSQWGGMSFTQEFYICEAVPSVFPDTNAVYGFPACENSVSMPVELRDDVLIRASAPGDF